MSERHVRVCGTHRVELEGLTCPKGPHKATIFRVLDRKTGDIGEAIGADESEDGRPGKLEAKLEAAAGTATAKAARKGLKTDQDFVDLMAAVILDVAEEKIATSAASAIIGAADKVLKVAELRLRAGELLKSVNGGLLLGGGKQGA